MFLEFHEFETKYLAGVYKRHWTTIYVEYMLNHIVRAGNCDMIIVNKKIAVTYCQQALFILKVFIKCSLHCFLNILYVFFCVIICVYTCWKPVVLEKQFFLFHVLDLNPMFANQDPPPPTLRPRNSCICLCLSRRRRIVHKYPDCAHFLLVGRRSERLCRRLVQFNRPDYEKFEHSQKRLLDLEFWYLS